MGESDVLILDGDRRQESRLLPCSSGYTMCCFPFSIWAFISFSAFLLAPIGASTSSIGSPPAVLSLKEPPPGEVFVQDDDYNQAAYGGYVLQTFKSTDVGVPRLNMMRPFTACEDESYVFVTPRGEIVDQPTAAIYDSRYDHTPNSD